MISIQKFPVPWFPEACTVSNQLILFTGDSRVGRDLTASAEAGVKVTAAHCGEAVLEEGGGD